MTPYIIKIDKNILLSLDNIRNITKVGNAIKAEFKTPVCIPRDISEKHTFELETKVYQISFPDKAMIDFSDIVVVGSNDASNVIQQIYLLAKMDVQHKAKYHHITENSLTDQLQEEVEQIMCSEKYASLSLEDIIKVSSAATVKAINKKLKNH